MSEKNPGKGFDRDLPPADNDRKLDAIDQELLQLERWESLCRPLDDSELQQAAAAIAEGVEKRMSDAHEQGNGGLYRQLEETREGLRIYQEAYSGTALGMHDDEDPAAFFKRMVREHHGSGHYKNLSTGEITNEGYSQSIQYRYARALQVNDALTKFPEAARTEFLNQNDVYGAGAEVSDILFEAIYGPVYAPTDLQPNVDSRHG